MTQTTPVERVAHALEDANFRRVPAPLEIAGVTFDTAAAFVGTPPSPDLVVVGDTSLQTSQDLQRIVEGVGRALDVMRSRRPLTLVLVGPRPDSKAITSLSRYARVLPVGESADAASLSNWLAVLLPLQLPQPVEARGIDSLEELRGAVDAMGRELIDLALNDPGAIAQRFVEMVEEPFVEGNAPVEEPDA
ncbi:hypothetical protein [Bradyrhizobium liaoningense]|uniref:hypothetical protein n=1 Tax=Bradyrhizobium liaoningense TaxID=43992 RepID=UPI001BAE1535|nr:hypothetical protein [Bradyrhizobium liaoningense]MBR0948074.1 hypothetical protein [Bradyrhizobium liaoningense]